MELPAILEQRVRELGAELKNVKEYDGTQTTMALVVEMPDGTAYVAVAKDGQIEERPLAMAVTAAEVAEKVKQFSKAAVVSQTKDKILRKHRDEAEEGRKRGFIW